MNENKPLILFTNDDGIESPGLWAAVEALDGLGDLLVVAPREQQSGMGRSLPVTSEGRIYEQQQHVNGSTITVYAVDGEFIRRYNFSTGNWSTVSFLDGTCSYLR